MKYKPEWKGRLKYISMSGERYGQILWDGKVIGHVYPRSKPGAKSPGGMPTNQVFVAYREKPSNVGVGGVEHNSLTGALESLIPKD